MLLAMKMERELGKDEIFQLYLNKSFFGNRSYGIAAAAEFYYGKKLDELDLDEMASLAAIPKFPSSGNPLSNPERAQERRDDYVLARMAELGFVSEAEAAAARAVPMHASPPERPIEVQARSEEHTSERQAPMRISYAVFCLKKKKKTKQA